MEFSKSEQYNSIIKELKINYALDDICLFAAFSDGMLIYELDKGDVLFEFTILADDDLLREMTCMELLSLKRIKYFECSIFLQDNDGEYKNNGTEVFSLAELQNLN